MGNPCDTPMIRKLYRERVVSRWEIIEKETIDEIILRTVKVRDRLILELIARGGMRIGEVLKLRLNDIQDRKLILREPESGKEHDIVFIPQVVAERLRDYATKKCKGPHDRIFPISYSPGKNRMIVKACSLLCYWSVSELGIIMSQLARHLLGLSVTAISRSVERGKRIATEENFSLKYAKL